MEECDDVLLSLVCDISGRARPVFRLDLQCCRKSGVLVMELDEIVQYWHIIVIMIHKT